MNKLPLRKPSVRVNIIKSWKNNPKLLNLLQKDPQGEKGQKPDLKADILKEYASFKYKKAGNSRSAQEKWKRFKFVAKGLTLDEWSDRVESKWEHMLEYSEKIWENFIFYSFKSDTKAYNYAKKIYNDSIFAKGWRKEEENLTWEINSKVIWHKHNRLLNHVQPQGEKGKSILPNNSERLLGSNRLHLKQQLFTHQERQELLKSGSGAAYNTEFFSYLNPWADNAYIYLKYIKPWLLQLNKLEKAHLFEHKYLGTSQHVQNYQTIQESHVFEKEMFEVTLNLKIITKFLKENLSVAALERRYGKRNVKLFEKNKDKFETLIKYQKSLLFRQTNQNLVNRESTPIIVSPLPLHPQGVYNFIQKQNKAS